MEIPQARIMVFPVFPADVPSLFPDSGNQLKQFPVFSVFAIGTVSYVSSIAFITDREHWEHENGTRDEGLLRTQDMELSWNNWEQHLNSDGCAKTTEPV
jgi:hypothetical protein